MKKENECIHWGENRKDELYLDVGCTVGYAFCPANSECPCFKEGDTETLIDHLFKGDQKT